MKSGQQNDLEDIRKTINVSSSKNNNFLIFFTIFMLYILISVLGTTDLMLLLPEHMFKMPLINFDLNLIAFYILAPIMLVMLHFNILFNYNRYLKKIDIQHKKINMDTLDPSIYGYAYSMISRGFDGFLINLFLWIWIYIIPLTVLIFIYLRFADYHDNTITIFHLVMVLLDICLIFLSFFYNNIHLKHQQKAVRYLSYLFHALFAVVFILAGVYHYFIFKPVINNKLDTRIKLDTKKGICDNYIDQMYDFIVDKNESFTIPSSCFPRLVVNEAEMAKISHSALYLPRFLVEDNNKNKNTSSTEKEKQLILEYGSRSNLRQRNLRYANLYGCILTRADLTGSDLQSSDLRKSHLQAAKLIYANLSDANLMGAKLDKAEFKDANLTGANLTSAVSREGQFPSSTFINSIMIATNFKKADFSEANLTSANLINANLPYSYFYGTDLTNANLRGSDLTGARLVDSNLTKSNLTEVALYEAKLNNSELIEANLTAATLHGSNLSHTDFTDAILIAVDFSETYTDNTNSKILLKTILNSAKKVGGIIIDNNITNKKQGRRYLTDENLTECEKYLTIVLNKSDVKLKVTKRRIKYLIKGIKKYNNHKDEPTTKCPKVNSEKLSQTLQKALKSTCKNLQYFLDEFPQYNKKYEDTINDCQKDYTKKIQRI